MGAEIPAIDYGEAIKHSVALTWRARALWALGLISALQAVVFLTITELSVAPITLLPRLLSGASSGSSQLDKLQSRAFELFLGWLATHQTAVFMTLAALFLVWLVLGVFDVAVQGGLISQAQRVREGGRASASRGLHDGFAVWWRIMGITAVSSIPGVLLLLVVAVYGLFTVSIPLLRGEAPDPSATTTGLLLFSMLSALNVIASIPLSVLAQLALRFGVVDGCEWRQAFSKAWVLARDRFSQVALAYLSIFLLVMVSSMVLSMAIGVVSGIATVAVVATWAASGPGAVMSVGIPFVVLIIAVTLVAQVVLLLLQSVSWTLFWRHLTGKETLAPVPRIVTSMPVLAEEAAR